MLRLFDPRSGRLEGLPGGEVVRVQVLDGTDLRGLVIADLLRRVAERGRRRVLLSGPQEDASDYGVAPLFPEAAQPADLYVGPSAHEGDAWTLVVPPASGTAEGDALAMRLAYLSGHYREPLTLDAEAAATRLQGWRTDVATWASAPGRPLDRASVTEAEKALADDLNTPAALAVLDRVASDDSLASGTKLETFIHLDLLLGLNVVADIGRGG
ncbi:hypothetical protein [Actinomadura rupiterrae]|uniref:hypothetical protein n=1 Tax=Actinomadura rupiterrae TaxID=559627 RepID=UPI0020A2FEE4|nr:hypothetical protein [Actinomadura rupiterrae]MCP2336578.1 hypothetical protein [Actinomadura rupiterrae]